MQTIAKLVRIDICWDSARRELWILAIAVPL